MIIKILEWNINGRSNVKGNYKVPRLVRTTIEQKKPEVFVLVEYIPGSMDSDDWLWLSNNYTLGESSFKKGKTNSVLIGVKKEIKVSFDRQIFESAKDDLHPNVHVASLSIDNKRVAVIGFRMLTGLVGGYDEERVLFDRFISEFETLKKDFEHIVLVGDFNNAKHYGEISSSFDEVEPLYWTRKWDDKRKRYVGNLFKREQYSYNLHIIQDILKSHDMLLCEKEEDYSFSDKYNNLIHDDHIFVDRSLLQNMTVDFAESIARNEGLDHKCFTATINMN